MTDSAPIPIGVHSWGTDSSGYDRANFYVASQDAYGKSSSQTVSVPQAMTSQIAALIQSGRIPSYRTKEDFFRDAFHHRLHDLEAMIDDPEFTRRTAIWRRLEERAMQRREMEATEQYITETAELLKSARGEGDVVLEETIVQDAEAAAVDMHEPWKGRLLGVVREGNNDA